MHFELDFEIMSPRMEPTARFLKYEHNNTFEKYRYYRPKQGLIFETFKKTVRAPILALCTGFVEI